MEADGMLVPPKAIGREVDYYAKEPSPPTESLNARELFPFGFIAGSFVELRLKEPERYKLPYQPEAWIICRTNHMTNSTNPQALAELVKKIPFIVAFALELNEVCEFADIVLPDTHQLERLTLFPNRMTICVSPASGHYFWGVQQPVVPPAGQARNWRDVMMELAERLGFLEDFNELTNALLDLREPYRLEPSQRYPYEEIADRWAKSRFGPERGLDWFRHNGYYSVKRTLEQTYPTPFIKPRFPIYFEILKRQGEAVKTLAEELDFPCDTGDYQALPDWKPCQAHEMRETEYDLFAINYKVPFHFQSFTSQNPWLSELGEHHPYAFKILLHTETATRKGIRDGEQVWVESVAGRVQGQAKVTEGVHPEVAAIAGVFGAWARGKPIAQGKGAHFNTLLPLTANDVDWVSSAADGCVRVKVYRA